MPAPAPKVSLDQIMSERQFSARSDGNGLVKIRKGPASWNAENRTAKFIMTAEVVDRYGDIVVTKGGDTSEFEKNPVALWAHDSRNFPIGMWSDLKKISGTPKRMEGLVGLTAEDTTEEADTVAKLLEQDMIRACSIGFMPKAWESMRDEKERFIGYKFLEWELLECSVCSIPANPAALVKAAGGNMGLALQAIELVLEEWARTPDGLIVPRSEYERAYEIVKDKEVTLHEVRSIDEEDEDAAAPVLNTLDIEAAVARGVGGIVDGAIAQIAKMFGKTVPTAAAADDVEKDLPVEDEDGETDEQFQARLVKEAADKKAAEDELADEAEELALRNRVAEMA